MSHTHPHTHIHTHTYTHTHTAVPAPSPPPPPQLDELMEICAGEGDELENWDKLGTALGLPSEDIERIKNTHQNKSVDCLEDVFKVRIRCH